MLNLVYETIGNGAALEKEIEKDIVKLKNLELNIGIVEKAISDLQFKKNNMKDACDYYKKSLINNLKFTKKSKFKNALHAATLCKEQLKLVVISENNLPDKYIDKVIVEKINKKAINDEFKESGEIPEGCKVETYQKLIIK